MIFLSTPSVYNLPGTWEKQPDVLIPHLHLTPDQGFIFFFGLVVVGLVAYGCLLYTSPSPRDVEESRMPSSA